MNSSKTLIVIVGPTASGKTAAAIAVAKYYNTVVVQPIAWKASEWEVSEWDAEGEIEELKNIFRTYFDYQVEETFLIRNNANAQQSLEKKIRLYVDKGSKKALPQNDLLIVPYNGHGMDGYKNGCKMMWE